MSEVAANHALNATEGLTVSRRFTTPGVHPFDELEWETRDALIGDPESPAFRQDSVEFPKTWSQNATNIVALLCVFSAAFAIYPSPLIRRLGVTPDGGLLTGRNLALVCPGFAGFFPNCSRWARTAPRSLISTPANCR